MASKLSITEQMERANKRKYYEYTYVYSRYNPQLGCSERSSTVIASSDAEAKKLAKRACSDAAYGSNDFERLAGKGPVLTKDVDYRLTTKKVSNRDGWGTKEVVAEKIY